MIEERARNEVQEPEAEGGTSEQPPEYPAPESAAISSLAPLGEEPCGADVSDEELQEVPTSNILLPYPQKSAFYTCWVH